MITTKYFDGVRNARATQAALAGLPPFDLGRLRSKGRIGARIAGLFTEDARWWLKPLRRWWPIVRVGKFVLVTRNADVRDILERGDEFETPYGPEMAEMAGGANFILGMQDGADYRRMKSSVLSAFPPQEVEKLVRPIAARHSQDIMARAEPGFDAIGGLLKVVPARICREYFGVVVDDETEFTDWSIALSTLFFSDPFGSATTRELAVVAADRMIRTIDRSIEAVRQGRTEAATPLARMVALMDQGKVTLDELHAVLLGMIAGFAPTNILAGGNCLDVILSKPEAQQAVEAAIATGDNQALDAAILEAMRFKPIWIGPWRYAARDAYIAKGTSRERLIKQGTTVMPSTLSAMFDADAVANPDEFQPKRAHRDYLVYGHGIHLCIGVEVARVQIGESLRALFQKKGVRRMAGKAGKMTRLGAFPETLRIAFERAPLCRTMPHAMVTVVRPVKAGVPLAALRDMIAALGNPAGTAAREALDAAGIIHFASIAIAETTKAGEAAGDQTGVLVLEMSGDGSAAKVIEAFARHAEPIVRPILEAACGLASGLPLQQFLDQHNVDISPSFGSSAGLVFSGTPGHSIARILAEAEVAEIARTIAEKPRTADAGGASTVLQEVRAVIAATGRHDWVFQSAESQLEKPQGSFWRAAVTTLRAPAVLAVATAVLLASWWVTYALVFGPAPGFFRNLLVAGTSLLLSLLGTVALAVAISGACLLALRRLEKRDRGSSASIELDRLEEILDREDRTAQNHLTAISVMKHGTLRRLALRLAFYLISISARQVFRPGFLANINTIHFARWVLLPGTDRLIFLSNYDGSWESYLEDFIAKASKGLTGVWSNAEGFPRTRWLFLDGARDGDRFKRWARRQQVPTLFWYSAYPDLNTRRIRINSRIRLGIANATDSEARDWLSLFGSRPRPRLERQAAQPAGPPIATPTEQLEAGEIQSIFYNAFGALEHGHMLALAVPEGLPGAVRRRWLDFVTAKASFGDPTPRVRAMTVGFGPQGLLRLGLEAGVGENPLARFPVAFRHGLGSPARSRILDDVGDSRPQNWRWGSPDKPVDMVLLCYAADPKTLRADVAEVIKEAKAAGLKLVSGLPLNVRREGRRSIEHFGFADGVSQPVVRGTARAHAGVAPMHLVAAGEFLFGYRDEHGFYPVSPGVKAAHDPMGILPALRFRHGSDGTSIALHDFGRNGSFLVVRQFEQHADDFHAYCALAAKTKAKEHDDPAITPRWIAAKMMGRWHDGSSLVRNPEGRPGRAADNNFSFGAEDPQGHRCPLGAHIRRANPRDSLGDDHETQIAIGKRHRILRVGRTYEQPGEKGGKPEKGLLFACLNVDIERQYEFMQQTWVSAGSFHDLPGEKDPSIGSSIGQNRFSIPTWEGGMVLKDMPSFVTTRGGGYFFMPSRSALRYLLSRL